MEHRLKTIQPYFNSVKEGVRTFELCKSDRDFKVGDTLVLEEWTDTGNIFEDYYTGQVIRKNISYVLKDCPQFGLKDGYCILGLTD